MVKSLGSDYDSHKHSSFIITKSVYGPKDFRASRPMFINVLLKVKQYEKMKKILDICQV